MKITFAFLASLSFPFAVLAQMPPVPLAQEIPMPKEPNNSGPVKLLCASWFGGPADDEITGVGVSKAGTIFLAGNSVDLKLPGILPASLGHTSLDGSTSAGHDKEKNDPKGIESQPGITGFLVQLTGDGQRVISFSQFPAGVILRKLTVDDLGNIYILGDAKSPIELGNDRGTGAFVAMLTPDAKQIKWAIFRPEIMDFGLDSNGEIVVLLKGHMQRFRPGGKEPVWDAAMPSHGDNRPGGMAVSPQTGVAVATGYGMTRTGHEPYKDPYAYAFDRAGKQIWSLWNPEPTLEAGANFGGNGLMADTTGVFCSTDEQGRVYLGLRADGGNTVTSRDPCDPSRPLDPNVFRGVFQDNAGFGFKGASMSSVIFRADALTGKFEKATYMTAWLTPARANGLLIAGAAGEKGNQYVIGGSASGFKSKNPWYEAPAGGYKGGGFLAVFDREFKMLQAGYFSGSSIRCVAVRNGLVVIGGSAVEKNKGSDKSIKDAPEIIYGVPTYKPVQPAFGGGKYDGYVAIFRVAQ